MKPVLLTRSRTVKRIIIISAIIIPYFLFLYFLIGTHDIHGHHGKPNMKELVEHHLTDHVVARVKAKKGFENPVTDFVISINNGISHLNETTLKDKFFGIFDMRITKWVIMLWVGMFLSIIVFLPLSRRIKKETMGSESRWVNAWEVLIAFVHDDVVAPNFDHGTDKKVMPYFAILFFFLFFTTYPGLFPGSATATGNLAVTAGLALFTLVGMIGVGTVKQGPLWIFKGIVPSGVPVPMYALLWPIELMGLAIKPFALTIRLFANMTAGHVVIIIFLYLVVMFQSLYVGIGSVVGSLMIFMLELLVCLIQTYIFTVLSAMFIGSSMHSH